MEVSFVQLLSFKETVPLHMHTLIFMSVFLCIPLFLYLWVCFFFFPPKLLADSSF